MLVRYQSRREERVLIACWSCTLAFFDALSEAPLLRAALRLGKPPDRLLAPISKASSMGVFSPFSFLGPAESELNLGVDAEADERLFFISIFWLAEPSAR